MFTRNRLPALLFGGGAWRLRLQVQRYGVSPSRAASRSSSQSEASSFSLEVLASVGGFAAHRSAHPEALEATCLSELVHGGTQGKSAAFRWASFRGVAKVPIQALTCQLHGTAGKPQRSCPSSAWTLATLKRHDGQFHRPG